MIKLTYTDETRDSIIATQVANGLALMEDQCHFDGKFLIFGTSEEYDKKFPKAPQPPDRLAILEGEINALKGELATAKIRLDAAERKVSTLEKATVK